MKVNNIMPLLGLAIILLCVSAVSSKKFFYIYDWPDYMNDVWPPEGAELHKDSAYHHHFRGNNGAGIPLQPNIGYFSTWQFSMYQMVLARLRVSEYRTMDPKKATSFIVPFDIGAHSFIDHNNGRSRVAAPHGWRAIEYLKEAMQNPTFWKNGGHDHFVFFSVTAYQATIGIGAKVFLTQPCENCTVFTIETSPTFTSRKYYSGKSRKWWFAVPYPSSFHWCEGIKELPWERKPPGTRSNLSIFIGSLLTSTPASNKLRKKLFGQCQQDQNQTSPCLWFDTPHSDAGVVNQVDNLLRYRNTIFCLAPPGDSLTRKSIFDSLMTGCIPVIFVRASISQYIWHITPEEIDQVSVYIPMTLIVEKGLNFLHILRSISAETIRRMQEKIEQIAPRLQYSVVPDHATAAMNAAVARENQGSRSSSANERLRTSIHDVANNTIADSNSGFNGRQSAPSFANFSLWTRPPFPDAVDVIIDKLLDRNTVEPVQGFSKEQRVEINLKNSEFLQKEPIYTGYLQHTVILPDNPPPWRLTEPDGVQ